MGGYFGRAGLVAAVVFSGAASGAAAMAAEMPQTVPGALRSYATIHSIGLE